MSEVFLSTVVRWTSHVKDIIELESVQRQISKFILNDYVSHYHEIYYSVIYFAFVLPSRNNQLVFFIQLPLW